MLVVAPMVSQSPPPVPCHAPPQTLPLGRNAVPDASRLPPLPPFWAVLGEIAQDSENSCLEGGLDSIPYFPLLSMCPSMTGGQHPTRPEDQPHR
jgi:hypothetical protein